MKTQLNFLFWLWCCFIRSGMFMTRLPLGWLHPKRNVPISTGATAIFFPVWGLIIAMISMLLVMPLVWSGTPWFTVSIVLLFLGTILSGALHEDGFADCCDGFWGGQTPEARHQIMKDSTVGSYGAIGLIASFLLRWICLVQVESALGILLFIVMHTVPRGFLGILWASFPLWQGGGLAKARPSRLQGLVGLLLMVVMLFLEMPPMASGLILLFCGLGMLLFCLLALRKLGGLNGDCFGGAEQFGQIILSLLISTLLSNGSIHWD